MEKWNIGKNQEKIEKPMNCWVECSLLIIPVFQRTDIRNIISTLKN
jgi:pyruvate-formate lyase-activating enzyme